MGEVHDWFSDRINNIKDFFTGLGDKAREIFTEKIPGFFDKVKEKFGVVKDFFKNGIDNIKEFFSGLGDKIKEIFTEKIPEIFKTGVNYVIAFVNKMIGGVETALNAMINALNTLSWDVPDWVPWMGGKTFGFNIPNASFSRIPELAQGTVIPPSMGEFIAKLGDNNKETEVVSPLSTIQEALANALEQVGFGGSGEIHIHVDLDGREIAKSMVKQNDIYRKSRGRSMFA